MEPCETPDFAPIGARIILIRAPLIAFLLRPFTVYPSSVWFAGWFSAMLISRDDRGLLTRRRPFQDGARGTTRNGAIPVGVGGPSNAVLCLPTWLGSRHAKSQRFSWLEANSKVSFQSSNLIGYLFLRVFVSRPTCKNPMSPTGCLRSLPSLTRAAALSRDWFV